VSAARRRLQQRGAEGQDGGAVGTRAFGKDNHQHAVGQRGFDFAVHLADVGAALALNKNRPGNRREPAEQRPAAHVRLGHEHRRRRRGDGENVEVTQVIADEQPLWGISPETVAE